MAKGNVGISGIGLNFSQSLFEFFKHFAQTSMKTMKRLTQRSTKLECALLGWLSDAQPQNAQR
jgi:hypothetical protein